MVDFDSLDIQSTINSSTYNSRSTLASHECYGGPIDLGRTRYTVVLCTHIIIKILDIRNKRDTRIESRPVLGDKFI